MRCRCGLCRPCKARAKRAEDRLPVAGHPPDVCDLCGGPPRGRWGKLHYDHQHGTKVFRGWLCNMCNQALGLAGDNPSLLRRMADYLDAKGYTLTRPVLR